MKKIFLIITLFFILVMSDAYSIYALEPTKMPECTEEPTLEPVIDESDITFEILGEVNEDGIVDATDALLILKHASRLETLTSSKHYLADINVDDNIDAADALDVLKISAKIEVSKYYAEMIEGDKLIIDDIVAASGTPYWWQYESSPEEGLNILNESKPVNPQNTPAPGDPYEQIYTIEAVSTGVYEFRLILSNGYWAEDEHLEVLEEILYIIRVKSVSDLPIPTISPIVTPMPTFIPTPIATATPILTEIPEGYYTINSGDSKDVTISTDNEKITFEFTPSESGYYRYHSSGDMYAEFGTINDADGNLLVQRTDYAYIEYGWHPVFFGEFEFDYYFEAGKTYLLEAFLEDDNTGNFSVTLMPLSEPESVIIEGAFKCPYGAKRQLTVDYAPEYSIGFVETWESDNTDIVSVDNNGEITGKGIGKANITVTTTKGLTYTTEIEVTDHNEIYVGEVKNHMSVFESEDYYKFIPEEDGEYIIKSRRQSGGNTYSSVLVTVYNSDFNEKLYFESGISYDIICEFKAGEAYYLHVQSNAGDYGFMQFIEIVKSE